MISAIVALFLILFGTVGCNEEMQVPEDIAKLSQNSIKVIKAPDSSKKAVISFLSSQLGRISHEIQINDLLVIIDHQNQKALYTLPNVFGDGFTLNLSFSDLGDVESAFLSKSEVLTENLIKSTIYSLDYSPMVEIIDNLENQKREIYPIFHGSFGLERLVEKF